MSVDARVFLYNIKTQTSLPLAIAPCYGNTARALWQTFKDFGRARFALRKFKLENIELVCERLDSDAPQKYILDESSSFAVAISDLSVLWEYANKETGDDRYTFYKEDGEIHITIANDNFYRSAADYLDRLAQFLGVSLEFPDLYKDSAFIILVDFSY